MSGGTNSHSSGVNQTWDELPPRRRRFWLWLVLLLFLIAPGARIPLEIVGIPLSVATLVALGAALLILVPLGGGAAWLELRDSYVSGAETPPRVTARGVAGWTVSMVILWGVFAVLTVFTGPLMPTMPVVVTVMTAQRWYQWRLQPDGPAPS